ncbi:HNH endonuclease [Streptomyces sp. KMM 9044]|uniref:HNH endonuclease n=1 Tax=Streptomyces sp. KMM 9044 TaxID=2744474 RepID=UPI002151680E|nr:HNH endonuclease [Streptomyces sp. KMM 9044]WAX79819.1 HNH endonuclease [Streptomyces sp. KMM 9044]
MQTLLERRIVDVLAELEDEQDQQRDEQRCGEKFPRSRSMRVRRLIRDTAAAERIKSLHEGKCQLCGLQLVGPDGKTYSEGAHIRPLGKPHHGPDVEPNILHLCPNCHVRLDVGAVAIDEGWSIVMRADMSGAMLLPKLTLKGSHRVRQEYLHYHRTYWEKKGASRAR